MTPWLKTIRSNYAKYCSEYNCPENGSKQNHNEDIFGEHSILTLRYILQNIRVNTSLICVSLFRYILPIYMEKKFSYVNADISL